MIYIHSVIFVINKRAMAGRKSKRDPNKKYIHISTYLTEEAIQLLEIALATTHRDKGSKQNLISFIIEDYLGNKENSD